MVQVPGIPVTFFFPPPCTHDLTTMGKACMGIVIVDPVDIAVLAEYLQQHGWMPTTVDGQPAFQKEVSPWLWLVRLRPRVEFISWVMDDAQPERHAEGLRRLKREVEQIAEAVGFRLMDAVTFYFGP